MRASVLGVFLLTGVLGIYSQIALAFNVRFDCENRDVKNNVEALINPIKDSTSAVARQAYRAAIAQAARRGIEALGFYQYHLRFQVRRCGSRMRALLFQERQVTTDTSGL